MTIEQVCKQFEDDARSGRVAVVPEGMPPAMRAVLIQKALANKWDFAVDKGVTVTKAAGEDADLELIATTGDIDRDLEVVDPEGMKAEEFLKNPVILWAHDMEQLPIGKGVYLRRIQNGHAIGVKFVPAEQSELAGKVKWYYENGYLNDASIRFRPLEMEAKDYQRDGYYYHINSWELLELSAVTIGANPKAGLGKSVKELTDEWSRSVEAKHMTQSDPLAQTKAEDVAAIAAEVITAAKQDDDEDPPAEPDEDESPADKIASIRERLARLKTELDEILDGWDEDVYGEEGEAADDENDSEGGEPKSAEKDECVFCLVGEDAEQAQGAASADNVLSNRSDGSHEKVINLFGSDTPATAGEARKTGEAGVDLRVLERIVRDELEKKLKYRLGIVD